jgi:D-xylose transport system permease protein
VSQPDTSAEQTGTATSEPAIDGAPDAGEPVLDETDITAVAPEVLATSMHEYFLAWGRRIRSGESGALPIVIGLVAIVVFFQLERSSFLSDGNLVNLLVQAAVFIMFGAAEIFALLLSEIDLSVGYTAAVGAFVIAELIAPPVGLPWWLGIIGGLAATSLIGILQGSLVTLLNLPSFVVTLGGFLAMEGVMLELANIDKTAVGGVIPLNYGSPIYKLVNANMSPELGWIVLVVGLAGYAAVMLGGARRRRSQGLTAPPVGINLLTIAVTAVGGIVVVLICNANRGALVPLEGVPWVVPVVIVVLLIWTFVLLRTRLGRYIYAIGANPEAARRAGINVHRIRIIGFMLCSMTAGIAGLVYESRLGNMSVDFDGGTAVLYAVAAAVIGGTSLFGGRGRPMHALLGGIVIAVVFNGLGLMGVGAAVQDICTAVVLIAAVVLDALVRRRSTVTVR